MSSGRRGRRNKRKRKEKGGKEGREEEEGDHQQDVLKGSESPKRQSTPRRGLSTTEEKSKKGTLKKNTETQEENR